MRSLSSGPTDGVVATPPLTEAEALALLAKRERSGGGSGGGGGVRCWGSVLAPDSLRRALTTRLTHGDAFVCTLVSWYERHSVRDSLQPYWGADQGGRGPGMLPLATTTWDAKRPIPAAFTEAEATVPLPDAAAGAAPAVTCPACYGVGYPACRRCRRKGNVGCPGCHGGGGGGEDSGRCFGCAGRGTVRCPACSGRLSVECDRCQGAGRVQARRLLHARWTVSADRVFLTAAGLPPRLLAEAEGRLVLRHVGPRAALSEAAFPLGLVLACEVLVNRHLAAVDSAGPRGSCRLLLQRQTVRLVPVSACEFRSGGAGAGESEREGGGRRHLRLFVYGSDRRVHWEKLQPEAAAPLPEPGAEGDCAAGKTPARLRKPAGLPAHSTVACGLL